MEIKINGPCVIEEITQQEFNVLNINSIKKENGALRQQSKGPT